MIPLRIASLLLGAAAAVVIVAFSLSTRTPGITEASPQTEEIRAFWTTYREATALRMKNDFKAAATAYARALALRPNHEDSLYYLGNSYLEEKRYADALEAFRRLVTINPDGSSRAHMQMALVRASLDDEAPRHLPEAERLFQRALDTDPDSGALLGLGEVALLAGRHEEACVLLERAHAENTMSMAAPYLLGYLAFRDGRRDEAWRLFRLAVQRGDLARPPVTWSEEGDVKADPALRWRALARQSVFGAHWIRLRSYLNAPGPSETDMRHEYEQLAAAVAAARP